MSIPSRISSTRRTSRALEQPLSRVRVASQTSGAAFPPLTTTTSSNENPEQTGPVPFPQLDDPSPTRSAQSRYSMPVEQYSNLPNRHPSASSAYTPQLGRHPSGSPMGLQRPVSTLYPQQSSGGYAASSSQVNGASYRLRSESPHSFISGVPHRSDSRGGSAALQAGVPSQDGEYTDRAYRQTQPSGNSPLPPRRSSRALAAAPSDGLLPLLEPTSSASEQWKERGASTVVRKEVDKDGHVVLKSSKKGVKDFIFGRSLGEGSYSTVMAATDRQTLKEYAIKVLDKGHIIKENKVKYVNIERDTLNRLNNHPGIVRLYFTFQDQKSLYFVLDLANNGELLGVLKKMWTFDIECTRFYGAQILDAVEYMHRSGVIHRDLKPENVLLDDKMHVKITDFGTANILDKPTANEGKDTYIPFADGENGNGNYERTNSFVGTAEYVSPELLVNKYACKASDLWAYGCIIFQLLAGRPPFKAANEFLTFRKICALEYEFPKNFPPVAKDLVERLLVLDPTHRLSIEHIKNHEFFDGIVWGKELWRQTAPRLQQFKPQQEPPNVIKLNGFTEAAPEPQIPKAPTPIQPQPQAVLPKNGNARPHPRVITELPPPSQLDIDWSPVLTKNNERILKLGNLNVLIGPASHSENAGVESNRIFSRLFGGGHTKKKQRMVMVTSGARILMAPPGGDEKKTKFELSLLGSDIAWRTSKDSKGGTCWCIDTKDKIFTFEDTKTSPMDQQSVCQEWLDAIGRAKDIARTEDVVEGSYTGGDSVTELTSRSRGSSFGPETAYGNEGFLPSGNRLVKGGLDSEPSKGRKRFSKRHSKSGLAAVF
ncbi:MAG: pkb-activating kinase-like protein [Vezdaea aestivalis]|nr:MAG: pkb-activating kinase-like protein [Vezdaea aestivalis]